MVFTLTFTKVFEDTGVGDKGPWTRWSYLTADNQRFSTYKQHIANQIPLNQPVTFEAEVKNGKNFIRAVASQPAENQQQGSGSQNAPEAVRTAPVASQGHSEKPDWDAIARGKVKSLLWAALMPAMFSSITPKSDQTPEAASQLVDYAMGEVFPEDVPF